jgi:hypothetical protein
MEQLVYIIQAHSAQNNYHDNDNDYTEIFSSWIGV